ncbi:MAG: polyphosphate kinase 2, partial [Psychromonas sp.]|nr:polyphosphate kinase 2 [Psychromonas sp.]
MAKKKKEKSKQKKEKIIYTDVVHERKKKLQKKDYEKKLRELQIELVKLQKWINTQKLKVVVIFEGRDAAGKGGVIKRITQRLNPRICRVVAL